MSWIELPGDDVIADMDGDMATIADMDGDMADDMSADMDIDFSFMAHLLIGLVLKWVTGPKIQHLHIK